MSCPMHCFAQHPIQLTAWPFDDNPKTGQIEIRGGGQHHLFAFFFSVVARGVGKGVMPVPLVTRHMATL